MELVSISIQNLLARKGRTVLTLLGIIIGIAVIVAMISTGDALKITISDQIADMGYNKLFVMPKGAGMMGGGMIFTESDVKTVEKVSGIDVAAGMFYGQTLVEYGGELKGGWVSGIKAGAIEPLFLEGTGYDLYKGRFHREGESGVAVIGWALYSGSFNKRIDTGSRIKLGEKEFKVIGVFEEIGNSQDDTNIYLTEDDAWDLFGQKGTYGAIMAKTAKGVDPTLIAENVEYRLEKYRDADDFEVITTEQLIEQMGEVLQILTFVLSGIAAISLLVGGIGIMNTMLMNVMERTKEIGIMKAIGATQSQILKIFLTEAALISFLGAVFGVVLGYVATIGIAFAVTTAGFKISSHLGIKTILLAFVFAGIVGMVSGVYPARKAAKLDPIESLRYE